MPSSAAPAPRRPRPAASPVLSAAALAALLCAALAMSPAAQAADKLKIGFLTTLSGPGSALGIDIRDAFELALKERNGKLGGLPVDMTVVDDQQNPETAKQAVDRFLKQQKVDLVTGIVFSNVLLPVMPAILNSKTFYLGPNSGPQEYAGPKCNPYFFAVAWQNEDIPAAMGQYTTDQGMKSVYLLAPNYPGGRENLNGFKRFYKGKIADEVYVRLGQTDFAAELAAIRAAKPDGVFIFLPGAMGINFIKQYVAAGMSKESKLLMPAYSADEDTIKGVGDAILGAFNTSEWGHDMDNPTNRKFVADFQQAYGRLPTLYAAQSYDTALLIDAAVRDVKGNIEDKAALRKALEAARFDSVRGKFRFNTNHFPIQNYYMRVVTRDASGRITNRTLQPIFKDFKDSFAGECHMAP